MDQFTFVVLVTFDSNLLLTNVLNDPSKILFFFLLLTLFCQIVEEVLRDIIKCLLVFAF